MNKKYIPKCLLKDTEVYDPKDTSFCFGDNDNYECHYASYPWECEIPHLLEHLPKRILESILSKIDESIINQSTTME